MKENPLLKNVWKLNTRERRGYFVLTLILLTLVGVDVYLRIDRKKELPAHLSAEAVAVPDDQHQGSNAKQSHEEESAKHRELTGKDQWKHDEHKGRRNMYLARRQMRSSNMRRDYRSLDLRPFDPNKIGREEWLAMGLPAWQIDNLIKYREKGGVFRRPKDLARLYGMTRLQYERLVPFVQIDTQAMDHKGRSPIPFDINAADTTTWKRIRGIGTILSKRIVKYREALGGFVHVDQLKEVYGLSHELIDDNRSLFIVTPYAVRQLSINQAGFMELRRHPYISHPMAKTLEAYRTHHGPYQQLKDIQKTKVVPDSTWERLHPYLRL